jgi:hypothetical protein
MKVKASVPSHAAKGRVDLEADFPAFAATPVKTYERNKTFSKIIFLFVACDLLQNQS